ncbi:hypothetical protein P691DRAFT_282686 [Macrolepiota fuliginosa MF-IS2]|uniref:Uncharacterized protein n=1 Tax=Macrolepiota fuliginosa MF-IS2 TaxID=1400762 RepID=A0A9P5X618_9AGAR|nr:hypothetical protein P691DRAFT_282686 [Macrolepiota fuliginosa MF-IS2]
MSGGSPKPNKWAGRLGSAVRRSSVLSSFGRSPSRASSIHERDSSDSASITKQKVDTTPATLSPPEVPKAIVPSPINESPIREAAATEPAGPSPLAQQVRSASPEPMEATSPVGYVPPPVIDSSIGNPGAFTDQTDEELPQPVPVADPYMPSRPVSVKGAPSTRAPSVRDILPPTLAPQMQVEEPQKEPAAEPSVSRDVARSDPVIQVVPSQEVLPIEVAPVVPISFPRPEPALTAEPSVPARLPTPSFDEPSGAAAPHPDLSVVQPAPPAQPPSEHTEVVKNVPLVEPVPIPAPTIPVLPIPVDVTGIYPSMPVPEHQKQPAPVRDEQQTSNGSVFRAMPVYELNSGTEIWGGVPHSYDKPKSNGSASHHTPSIRVDTSNSDPFADPIAPRITVSVSDGPEMPRPHVSEPRPAPPTESRDEAHVFAMPLPPLHEVVPSSRPGYQDRSSTDLGYHSPDTDESRPLLGTSKGASYLQPPTTGHNTRINVSPMNGSVSGSWNPQSLAAVPRLHELGWIEYHLPDGMFYYVHPTRRVTTDVNLRTEKVLTAVTGYLENVKENVPSGCELWLRDAGTPRKGFVPSKSWVNHQTRSVIVDARHTGGKKKKNVEEDQLDMEYRYWSFMEGHPAHTTLPLNAKTEAFEALSWAWTDRLLPSNQVVPAPFSQDECQELNSLLRSFTADQDGIQTRLVARILIRVAIWRQAFFRPNKPLPKDVVSSASPAVRRRRPIIRTFFDIIISVICLGIPYIFFERHSRHRIDEESNFRSAGPMFIIGACTCLVAAIVLSASVTFLSLPGLGNLARLAGLIATLFASFSMAATLVAIFRYKADMVRSAPQISEGVMWISQRSLIFSLPMVFLAYALIGFITALVLYSIRGVSVTNAAFVPNRIASTSWTTVTAIGVVAGTLTSLLLLRRY